MTETTKSRPPTRRGRTSRAATAPESAATETPSAEVAQVEASGVRTPATLAIRLPFLTVTFTGPGTMPSTVPTAPAPAPPVAGQRDVGGALEKLAFYGGVAAMGAVGALEWPVAAAVAAGTWVAQHTPPVTGLLRAPQGAVAPTPAESPDAERTQAERGPAELEPAEREPATTGSRS